ncbi:hypothetical protein HMPREF0083_04038 [Aneurinibacillus aneurinilyticus ATCC 12856]|uniref:Uncharacterized protein n=1 Tax=Aneurinibacillus aneurinilyticus ATCC 12856 TaxID=649747 RepID=U1X046_ANEAE|nr:hypothetical protein HMPREF0083_04038 [Aneurinibacillus aneurinilyticus ATCC 12856]
MDDLQQQGVMLVNKQNFFTSILTFALLVVFALSLFMKDFPKPITIVAFVIVTVLLLLSAFQLRRTNKKLSAIFFFCSVGLIMSTLIYSSL